MNGRYYFTQKEILEDLGIKETSLAVSLSRLASDGKIKMIRKGFGIITALTTGVLHPSYFIDGMMKYLGAKYYVGLLSAASHWGASHQAIMVYYVVTDKVIKPVSLGRMKIQFVTKSNFDEITEIQKVAGSGGYYNVSTPELTAIDLIRYPKKSGHLNHVSTILDELIESIDMKKLISLCSKSYTPTSTVQRLGFILDEVLLLRSKAVELKKCLEKRKIQRIVLSSAQKKDDIKYSDYPFDSKWGIYLNTSVEPDS